MIILNSIPQTRVENMLKLEKLPYARNDLKPVMSQETIDYHYGKLAKGYVDRFNAHQGDADFNAAGAFLHNVFFPQLCEPRSNNQPHVNTAQLINKHHGSFREFKEEFTTVAMGIQGSGWVYLSRNGDVKTIKNHAIKNDIIMLVDWWEHAWALDYQADKARYLANMWKIINWDVVESRLK